MDFTHLLPRLTLEEKAALCTGADSWHTAAVKRLSLPSVSMSDGPHGLRRENGTPGDSVPATCFPSGSALACSFDRSLLFRLGQALSAECRKQGVSVLLGPAVNIKRSPLCGRNFEYYSEDPCLSAQMAAAYIKGVQSGGVGTALKHFAANNKENRRLTTDTAVDERTLREIYLPSFETAVQEAKPWSVMCAYNKLNGTYCSENKRLLTDILRKEWGFDGLVMSDWGAVSNRANGVAAGLDLEMPSSGVIGPQNVIDAVRSGRLSEQALDACVLRVLQLVSKAETAKQAQRPAAFSDAEHHRLAKEIAERCMVLLKNDDVLPLKKSGALAVIGGFAMHPRYQGGGSSHIHPTVLDRPYDAIRAAAPSLALSYSEGYAQEETEADGEKIRAAAEAAARADAAVVFAGLPASRESEGFDRVDMRMPESHNRLIEAVAAAQKNTVVVLSNGAPVEMPWIQDVSAVLESYLCGQATGSAQAALLFGDANPSGKLAETFPQKLSDNPSYLNFPEDTLNHVAYREGVFVGYRYYEKKELRPLFPFGHGLSYTHFSYRGMQLDRTELNETETLTASVQIANEGPYDGREIVQLYVRALDCPVMRPLKELRGFENVFLKVGEEKSVTFRLSRRAFAYYDAAQAAWTVADGRYELLAGTSSASTPLSATVLVHPAVPVRLSFSRHTLGIDVWKNERAQPILRRFLMRFGVRPDTVGMDFLRDMPLRNLYMLGARFTETDLERLVNDLNQAVSAVR